MFSFSKEVKKNAYPSFVGSHTFVVGGGVLVAMILLFSSGWLYLNFQIHTPKNPNGESQEFVVAQGESVSQVASNLEAEGIIKDDLLFLVYWKLKSLNLAEQNTEPYGTSSGSALNLRPSTSTKRDTSFLNLRKSASIKAGEYSLSPALTISEIVLKLTQGETKTNVVTVTIPEGFNIYEVDKRLAERGVINQGELLEFAQNHRVKLVCQDEGFKNCSIHLIKSDLRPSASSPRSSTASTVRGNQSPISFAPSPTWYRGEFTPKPDAVSGSGSSVSSLEGWLFPDTYKFNNVGASRGSPASSVEAIVQKMLSNFERKVLPPISEFTTKPDAVGSSGSSVRSPKGDVYQCKSVGCILAVASIVEKEVHDFEKKRLVAGVIYNRLSRGMKLDSCPTVLYAQLLSASNPYLFIEKKREHNPVTLMDTEINSPYNTYKNKGLPPTPISNPGLDSLKAASDPAETDYLYYLSKPSGQTLFSKTYEEHLRKKEKYLR